MSLKRIASANIFKIVSLLAIFPSYGSNILRNSGIRSGLRNVVLKDIGFLRSFCNRGITISHSL